MDGFLFPRRAAVFAAAALGLVASPAWAGSFPLVGTAGPMVIDPTTQSTIYVAFDSSASESDIYKSTDWGVTWTFSQALPYVADLEIDPQNHSILYASTAVPGTAVIFKSTDSGVTWSEADSGIPVVSGEKGEIYLLAVDPVNEGVVYAAGKTSGLYKSTDGGQNWTSIDGGIDTLTSEDYEPVQLRVDPSNPSTVYFGMVVEPPHGHSGLPVTVPTDVYKSTDGGATWNATGSRFVSTTVDPANFSHLVTCDGSTLQSSMDGGVTWVAGASCMSETPTIVISDTNPNQIFVAYVALATVWGSTDGGATLNPLYTFPQEVTSIASRSGSVYVGAYNSGLYISRDSGATWTQSSSATSPQTINVPAEEPTIQAAINAANNGDTVLVAPGTYYEKLDFLGKAITLKSSGGADVTILDGNNNGPIVTFKTNEGNGSVLQGFTLTHAQSASYGSAVHIASASPTIFDNIFVDDTQAVGSWGAAIGGDVASPIIIGNLFEGNSCDSQLLSGVVVVVGGSAPAIVNNIFLNNSCRGVNMTLPTGNKVYVSNNTFAGNPVGIRVDARVVTSAQVYRNNILFNNTVGLEVDFGSVANYPTWKYNLVFGSTTADYQGIPDQTGTNGNLSSDPRLKDWATGDVHLLYGSPAIDVGDMSAPALPATDYYDNTRVYAGMPGDSAVVDIGATEYEPPLVAAADGSVSTVVSTVANGTLGSANTDPGEPLVFALVTLPTHGSITITNADTGAFQYVPASGYIGSDSFTFHITDPYGTVSNTAIEQVTVVDPAPTANGGNVNTAPNIAVTGTLSATAAFAGQTLSFSVVSNPTHGTVTLNASNGQFRYVPAQGFHGTDSFTFDVTDQYGAVSNVATEQVLVGAAATANDGHVITMPDTPVAGSLSATTAYAGQKLTFRMVSNPAHGSVTLTPGSGKFSYTPATGYAGADSFTFEATDGLANVSNVATESVTVTDRAPKAEAARILVMRNQLFRGNLPASTAYAGQVLSYGVVSGPAHGTLTITNAQTGAYTYKVDQSYKGKDSFTFQVVDQWGTASNVATGTVSAL